MKLKPIGPTIGQVPVVKPGAVFRATQQGFVVQTNPPRPVSKRSKAQRDFLIRFKFAGRMAANPSLTQLETAIEMARGTEQVPRDILTMAALGRYYIFEWDDGTTYRHVRTPTVTSPLAYRQSAIYLDTPALPWQGFYLSIGKGFRLIQ